MAWRTSYVSPVVKGTLWTSVGDYMEKSKRQRPAC